MYYIYTLKYYMGQFSFRVYVKIYFYSRIVLIKILKNLYFHNHFFQIFQRHFQKLLVQKQFFCSTSTKNSLDISGIYPPMATPFNADESIAYDKLKENIEKWNKIPFKGYCLLQYQ